MHLRIVAFLVLCGLPIAAADVTFHKDVAPILRKNCQGCHRPGEAAPMSLLTYKETRPFAAAIRLAVAAGKMPPWHADPAHGQFANDRRLSPAEVKTLTLWASTGAKEGSPKDAPPPLQYTAGWTIGKPDAVIDMGADYKVPASGTIDYTFFVAPTGFTEDKWVEKLELRPGARNVVHHIVLMARPPQAAKFYLKDVKPGEAFVQFKSDRPRNRRPDTGVGRLEGLDGADTIEMVGIYVPGGDAYVVKPGQGRLIKAGSDLIFQMHYTTDGKEVVDRTKVGIVFAKQTPKERVINTFLSNRNLHIPAGDPAYRVEARATVNQDVQLQTLFPHMHLRGKAMQYRAVYPTGETQVLLNVPQYDFNWQMTYELAKPLLLPKGTRLEVSAWYDNSPNNKFNPNPAVDVYWGDQSWEEMLAGFADLVIPIDMPPASILRAPAAAPASKAGPAGN